MYHRRVLIGLVEVAGFYSNLSKGFKALGFRTDYVTFTKHRFQYDEQEQLPLLLRLRTWALAKSEQTNSLFPMRTAFRWMGTLVRMTWAFSAILHYDVFIFGYGTSLLPKNLDLPILKLLRKTVISNLGHGSEARPPYIDGTYQSEDGSRQPSPQQLLQATTRVFRKVQMVQRWSSLTIGTPYNLSHFSQQRFINLFALGLPADGNLEMNPTQCGTQSNSHSVLDFRPIRILHCPSHLAVKGTGLIEQAIMSLKTKGYSIDFIRLQGKPHREVKAEIQKCDFVVDQVFSDTPLASFALEAAWFGKPSVVGGYGLEELKAYFPLDMWPPSKICHPDGLESAIESLIADRQERQLLSKKAMKFARERWSAPEVAKRFLRLIHDDIPSEWWVDPQAVIYTEGVGLHSTQSRNNIRNMIKNFGIVSLHLGQKPSLEMAFQDFVSQNE